MTNFFDGFVFQGARSALLNAETTTPCDSGVCRGVQGLPTNFPTGQPALLEIEADQYRVATTLGDAEYLIWAANTSNLAVLEDSSWILNEGTLGLPNGGLTVLDPASPTGNRQDGTKTVLLQDPGGRSVAGVVSVFYRRGGTGTQIALTLGVDIVYDPASQTLALQNTTTTRTATNVPPSGPPAASNERGDQFKVSYYLQAARVWWTRNDVFSTRFGWNGGTQKWEPYRGGSPTPLGLLSRTGTPVPTLNPIPKVPVGGYLPGSSTGDGNAVVRVGALPNAASYAVVQRSSGPFNGILVVSEEQANQSYNFSSTSPPLAGVMGVTSGKITWNPAFVTTYEGYQAWYSPRDFLSTATGIVGDLTEAELYLAPIPSPLETPILRIGNRAPLTVIPYETESALADATIPSKSVGFALSTGKLKFNSVDVSKANLGSQEAPNPSFDPLYLGAKVRYEGVTLNGNPQPLKAPSPLLGITGTITPYSGEPLYIPDGTLLPGVGTSGILHVPDGTGNAPDPSTTPSVRPNASGLVRRLGSGFGDLILFSKNGAVAKVQVVDFETDLPTDTYSLPAGTAYVALQKHSPTTGSKVVFGADVAQKFLGQIVYFLQGDWVPCSYARGPRIISRRRDFFTLTGTETLTFRVGGTTLTWSASTLGPGTHTAQSLAASLTATLSGAPGSCVALYGHLVLQGTSSISIGFGFGGAVDLSGCSALGFIPGSSAGAPGNHSAGDPNWIKEGGPGFGFYRSQRNLDLSRTTPDLRNLYRFDSQTLSASVPATPYQFLSTTPREDLPGYDTGVYFLLAGQGSPGSTPILRAPLRPFKDLVYRFEEKKVGWISTQATTGEIRENVSALNLGVTSALQDTFHTALGGYLRLSRSGGSFQNMAPGVDFLVEGGTANLIHRVGREVSKGSRGSYTQGTQVFQDPEVVFSGSANPGDRLKILTGAGEGSYTVLSSGTHTLTVSPGFLVGGTNSSWVLTKGVTPGSIDPSVVADVTYENFNPLPNEPFSVKVLTLLGTAGSTLARVTTSNSLQQGKSFGARFTREGTTILLTTLTTTELGVVANGVLTVPHAGVQFTTGSFSLLVGTRRFTQGVDLLPVTSFSNDPGSSIEYLTTGGSIGLLKFGSDVLRDFASATAVYEESLLPASAIASGQGQIDPNTGSISLSQTDLTAHAGQKVYSVEPMLSPADVTLNPLQGCFTFNQPLLRGQLVEVTYFQAQEGTGDKLLVRGLPVEVTEFLPVFIRREVATRQSDQVYRFNLNNLTVDETVRAQVYAGTKLVTYGVPQGCTLNYAQGLVGLLTPVTPGTRVTVSYAVLEATGGETTYTVSKPPVWRPPLFIAKDQESVTLEGNRTSTLTPGKILRLGNFLCYIRSSTYSSQTGQTTVGIFPSPAKGVGTLSPGSTPLCLLSDRPVTPLVQSNPPVSVPGADPGFIPTLATAYGLSSVPRFNEVTKGQMNLTFEGDLTRYGVSGHVLEFFGIPYTITKSELTEDGRFTVFTLGSPLEGNYSWSLALATTLVRITVRPLYPSGATVFLGPGGFLQGQPYELVRYGLRNPQGDPLPGKSLLEGRDYNVDPGTGNLSLLTPRQPGLEPLQGLRFFRTESQSLAPRVHQGRVVYPRVEAGFAYYDPPSRANGRLGATLQASYSYEFADSFYGRAVSTKTYAQELSATLVREATPQATTYGAPNLAPDEVKNYNQGKKGPASERQDLISKDRIVRSYLGFYNSLVASFEQIEETLDGNAVGERDGKLRLWIGKGNQWVPPGYEDPITGALNPRNLWFEVWTGARGSLPPVRLRVKDPIISPLGVTVDPEGRPSGSYQDPASFQYLQSLQRQQIKNDLDDLVLTGRVRITRSLSGFITFQVTGYGEYRALSESSIFSRIFPQQTRAFTTTAPGLGADTTSGNPGVYSAGRLRVSLFGPDAPSVGIQSTTGTPIGRLENTSLGPIQNIQGATVRDRRARARVWSYSPLGYSELDPSLGNRPCLLATLVPLSRFPIVSSTGLPDVGQLASQSGGGIPTGLPDLLTGDPLLHTPPFAPGDQILLGLPGGALLSIGYKGTAIPVEGGFRYAGVYVDQVVKGCAITLKSKTVTGDDVAITDPSSLIFSTGPSTGIPFAPHQGDTLLAVPNTGSSFTASDPPTTEELQRFTQGFQEYRVGTDLTISPGTGEVLDATLPSFADPTFFGLLELTGQRPPTPLSTLEATVVFGNSSVTPFKFPALMGGRTLDCGDYSLPYAQIQPTELQLLGDSTTLGGILRYGDSPSPVPVAPSTVDPYRLESLYPDEILDNRGVIEATNPASVATLSTTRDLHPASTVYPVPAHQGVGSLEPFDLVLVSGGTGISPGSTGLLTVGAVAHGGTSTIEPPRFISRTNKGVKHDFLLENLQAWVSPGNTSGVVVEEDTNTPGVVVTKFFFSSIPTSALVLDDGSGGGSLPTPVGGYNDFMTLCDPGTKVLIKVVRSNGQFSPSNTVILTNSGTGATILLSSYQASGNNGSTQVTVQSGGLKFLPQIIEVRTTAQFFNFAPFDPVSPGPGIIRTAGYHDVSLSIQGVGSRVSYILSDRLTFSTSVDTRTAFPRGSTTPGGDPLACALTFSGHEIVLFDPVGLTPVLGQTDVNNTTSVNDSTPLTFKVRSSLTPSVRGVGWFAGGEGRVKAMGFEGKGNTPLSATDVTFAALPSSRQDKEGPIFNGFVLSDEVTNPPTYTPRANKFTISGVVSGDPQRILPGDLLVIQDRVHDSFLSDPIASGKAGSYLVRSVIHATHGIEERRAIYSGLSGDAGSWLGLKFPAVVSTTSGGSPSVTVSEIQGIPSSQKYSGTLVTVTKVFGPSGRLFILANEEGLSSTVSGVYATSVYSAAYSTLSGNTFSGLSDYRDGLGNTISQGVFLAAAQVGRKVSGMVYAPVNPYGGGIPENLSGRTNPSASAGNRSFYGFRSVTGKRGAVSLQYTANSNGELTPPSPGSKLEVYTKVKSDPSIFQPLTAPVYDDIPGVLDFSSMDWDTLHTTGSFPPSGSRCFLPGDQWEVSYAAQAAIYVEPSFPRAGNNLASTRANVVDSGHSLNPGEVGVRRLEDYLTNPSIVPSGGSLVEFAQVEVRRVRRWHGVNDTLAETLANLRYPYEVRRGKVATIVNSGGTSSLTADPVGPENPPFPIVGGKATQLGDFTNPKVNVHPGDRIRFLNAQGDVSQEAEILAITGSQTLRLDRALQGIPAGTRFEVHIQVPPVPQEQSALELLERATDKVVLSRKANYVTQSGGKVDYQTNPDPQVAYDQSVNKLTDTDPTINFNDVLPGDFVVVDPAGTLQGPTGTATPPERGKPPKGDLGVSPRISQYTPGGPSRVDDNRGYYGVLGVTASQVTVSASGNVLAGDRTTGDLIFGTSTGYVIYPTVHGSSLSGSGNGLEGQMDLRPTAFAGGGNSYNGTYRSVAPFSYRILRPSALISRETYELVLANRERTLSWVDLLSDLLAKAKGGSYWIFQRDQQLQTLGILGDPGSTVGLLTNGLLDSVLGRIQVAPFSNNETCLSILDRRFWGLDYRLDTTPPPYGSTTPYSDFAHGVGRPVLPDRIEVALNQRDNLRQTRFSWLVFRTHRVTGTLECIRRSDREIASRETEADQGTFILQTLEGAHE